MAFRITISNVGDVRRKLERAVGALKGDEIVGEALAAGAKVFGESIRDAYRSRFRFAPRRRKARGWPAIHERVKIARKARSTPNGPAYFSAADRSKRVGTPQAKWLHKGTRYQPARPWIFNDAIARSRSRARSVVRAMLKTAVDSKLPRV